MYEHKRWSGAVDPAQTGCRPQTLPHPRRPEEGATGMSEVTREDLKTILTFALHIARADDDLDSNEKTILGHYVQVIGISAEERAQMLTKSRSLNTGLVELSCDAARSLLLKTLCAMAHADGVRHDAEDSLIRRVYDKLGDPITLKEWKDWGDYEGEVLEQLNSHADWPT